MADDYDWSSIKDRVGDLVHHAYDAATGFLHPASAPNKPAATSQSAAQHVGIASGNPDAPYEGTGGAARKAAIDQAVSDAGG
jgi:hypothetical protein